MRLRYQSRRDLAEFARFPEGYEFVHDVAGGPRHAVILLTPPDQVAVRRADGTWYRRRRSVVDDGPQPYTMEWYLHYLRVNDLPSWFMRPEHTACLWSSEEAHWLGLRNESTINTQPPSNYLELRYPAAPQQPTANLNGDGLAYGCDIQGDDTQHDDQERLARHFPAAVASVMDGGYRIFVLPSGHLHIRYTHGRASGGLEGNEQLIDASQLQWLTSNLYTSYVLEGDDNTASAAGNPGTPSRSALENNARAAGGFVDIDQLPHGLGEFEWLDDNVDQLRARALGYDSPVDVVMARENGALTVGIPARDRPQVVYLPDRRYFNPREQPAGAGRWEYFTTGEGGSRDLAIADFGGQDDVGGNPEPSAADIWALRQRNYRRIANGDLDEDFTDTIDLVWIPGFNPTMPVIALPSPNDDQSPLSDSETVPTVDSDVIDPKSGLRHDPLNRGENDQTGTYGARRYQSRLINGSQYTVDRSRAHAGDVQPHKGWIVKADGTWAQWRNYGTLDWNNKIRVEKLNKWREQTYKRHDWDKKREINRPNYTEEEKDYLFDKIKAATRPGEQAKRPDGKIAALVKEFNRRFNADRDPTGITGVLDRLRHEYDDYGGHRKPKRRPGQEPDEPEDPEDPEDPEEEEEEEE